MSKTIIKIENLSKQYRLGTIGTGTIAHDLNRWWKTNILKQEDPYLKIGETNDRAHKGLSEYVWALKDINLEVKEGDVVGIIGKNGAGKSTLLKILSRVTAPTTGSIKVNGRLGSLLEVGTGFHPELTGRENIFLNGAILGMTKVEIRSKLDEIIDFSGCERYIDTPVKRYSSGMNVRLGFAVAAFLEPEILVVDEVLAVGDAEFQKKAIGKMQDVSKNHGRTVLFVSHNMSAIKNLCKSGVLLINGTKEFEGASIDTIDYYFKDRREKTHQSYWSNGLKLNEDINLLSIKAIPSNKRYNTFQTDKDVIIEIEINKTESKKYRYDFTLQVKDNKDQVLFPIASSIKEEVIPQTAGIFIIKCTIPKNLFNIGHYFFNFMLIKNKNQVESRLEDIITIHYTPPKLNAGDYTGRIDGFLRPHFNWTL